MTRSRHIVDTGRCTSSWHLALTVVAGGALALAAAQAAAQSSEEDELALAYGDKSFVSIATGSRLPVSRAPAVATVITAQDIEASGATDIDEVLETVPGLHVARETQGNAPVYVIRGIHLGFNPQVLMLVNGVPITTVYTGNRGAVWGGLPLENVARIEVIRGPGSALYGADAFAGVVNVITKTSADIDGMQAGLRAGSFNTRDGWLLHGGKWGAVDVAAYLRVGHTDGAGRTVTADAQTGLDALFGTNASHAPGPMNNGRDFIDGSLDLSLDKWRWRVGYKERSNYGSANGVASALDPSGQSYSRNVNSDLTYEDRNLAKDWALSLQASFMHYQEFSDLVLFPPGAFGGLYNQAFQDGVIGNPYKYERHVRLGGSALYTGFNLHRVRIGVGSDKEEIYKVRESKNFELNPDGSIRRLGNGSLADVIDVSDTAPFMRPHARTKRHVYAQDEWSLAKDWTLTAGLRHDHYSDFGSTTNPRVAVVWDAAYDVTAKVLYGSAFRAPSMVELYAINNPVVQGNTDLKPEKIKTLEAAVSWQPRPSWQLGLNVFRYDMADIIRLVDLQYQNAGRQTGTGMELEVAWDVSKALRVSGNYSYQRAIDEASGQNAGNTPRHHIHARADWRFLAGWTLHPQLNWIGERARTAGDTRASLPGYTTVDLTLRSHREPKSWDVALSVRNLFDADVREPSPNDASFPTHPFISLPNDFPLPGRSVYVQASYKF